MGFPQAVADMHARVFDALGVAGMVTRGAAAPVPVRIVVKYSQPRYGEFGQVIGRGTTVDFLAAEWTPEQGDVVQWTDHTGAQSRVVATPEDNNGYAVKAVMRG